MDIFKNRKVVAKPLPDKVNFIPFFVVDDRIPGTDPVATSIPADVTFARDHDLVVVPRLYCLLVFAGNNTDTTTVIRRLAGGVEFFGEDFFERGAR